MWKIDLCHLERFRWAFYAGDGQVKWDGKWWFIRSITTNVALNTKGKFETELEIKNEL